MRIHTTRDMKYFIIIFLCMSVSGGALAKAASPAAVDLRPGDTFPPLVARTIDGKPFDLAKDLKGKVVLLDYWATWCGPCVAEMPAVKACHGAWHDKGFEVVSISLDEDVTKAQAFLARQGMSWVNIADGQGYRSPLVADLRIRAIPQQILIGRDGNVFANNLRGDALKQAVAVAMTGSGMVAVAREEQMAATELPAAWGDLDRALAGEDAAAAVAALQRVAGRDAAETIAASTALARKYGNARAAGRHAAVLYELAESALASQSLDGEAQIEMMVARAHAGLALGGPYFVDLLAHHAALVQARGIRGWEGLLVHAAMCSGDPTRWAEWTEDKLTSRKCSLMSVAAQLEQLDQVAALRDHPKLQAIRQWCRRQSAAASGKLEIKPDGEGWTVRYVPDGGVLAAGWRYTCLLSVDPADPDAVVLSLPMDAQPDGGYLASIRREHANQGLRLWVRDESGAQDSNHGQAWKLP